MKTVYVYTDGSASVAGALAGQGGFATYFPDLFSKRKCFSMGFRNAKTGQMEVMALLTAILAMPETCIDPMILCVYSDSEYVVKSFTENRLQKWIKNDWMISSGEVKNKQLWQDIVYQLSIRKYLRISLNHIKSHTVDKEKDLNKRALMLKDPHISGNYIADNLANYKRHTILFEDIFETKIGKRLSKSY